jgi:hypothetical protein
MGCSCLVGAVAGIVFLILITNLGARAIQTLAQTPSGQQSVTVTVQEDYLNGQASKQINGNYPTGVNGVTLTGLNIDFQPDNRIDLHADFSIQAGFLNFNTSAGITNQISAQDGKIVMNMEGRPQIANVSIPIDRLPFNLSDYITNAVDRVNNDIILKRLNEILQANLSNSDLTLDAITTDDTSLTLHMKQQ